MGGFDIVIEVLRDPSKAKNRRLLRSYARLIESREAIYERTDAGTFQMLGDPHGLELDEVTKRVRPLLIAELQTTKELHAQLGEPKPSQEQVRLALDKLARQHEIRRDPSIESGSQAGKTYRWGCLNSNGTSYWLEVRLPRVSNPEVVIITMTVQSCPGCLSGGMGFSAPTHHATRSST